MNYLIYSIEDDADIANIISKTLSKQGYEIEVFDTAKKFFDRFLIKKPNMILLDMMLPDMHGLDILKKVREDNSNVDIDIIIISADHMLMTKVEGLDLGADDYIEKPFDLLELMSRVNARVRRHKVSQEIKISNVILNQETRICLVNGKEVQLTEKEFDILWLLFSNKNKVVSREEVLNKIWGVDKELETRTIDMHIKSIRNKLGEENKIIKTIYGIGYKVML